MSNTQKKYVGVFAGLVIIIGVFILGPTGLFSLGDFLGTSSDTTGDRFTNEIEENKTMLQIENTSEGAGVEAKEGDRVSVHYVGRFLNGDVFDSSVEGKDQPFTFTLGRGEVIQGWDQGVVGMKAGGRRTLTIPPELAYGEAGIGPIPPNSTLVFEVILVSISK